MKRMVSEHFSVDELACRCGCGLMNVSPRLVELLERMRHEANRPLSPTSGSRCEKRNREEKGAKHSKHLTGEAVDIFTRNGAERHELLKIAFNLGFKGIGVANSFIHVDIRGSSPTVWHY